MNCFHLSVLSPGCTPRGMMSWPLGPVSTLYPHIYLSVIKRWIVSTCHSCPQGAPGGGGGGFGPSPKFIWWSSNDCFHLSVISPGRGRKSQNVGRGEAGIWCKVSWYTPLLVTLICINKQLSHARMATYMFYLFAYVRTNCFYQRNYHLGKCDFRMAVWNA
jgi:hypothetical protein